MGPKNVNRKTLVDLANLGSIGFMMVALTFVGLGAGLFLDKITGLSPLFTLLGLLAGIAMGIINLVVKAGMNK
jgi:F0F1-type ATP synthase assembly protein I